MEWSDIYTARWGRSLKDHEVAAWDSEILYEIPNVNQVEICAALRELAQEKRRVGEGKYPVTCNDVISRILKMRHVARAIDSMPVTECARCVQGWYHFMPVAVEYKVVGSERPEAYNRVLGTAAIPCICAAGKKAERHAITSGTYKDENEVREMQRRVIR